MPSYHIAHIREQGIDLIMVLLDRSFASLPESQQEDHIAELQLRAANANLAGTVIPVWQRSDGRPGFVAPVNWSAYFESLTWRRVLGMMNKTLFW